MERQATEPHVQWAHQEKKDSYQVCYAHTRSMHTHTHTRPQTFRIVDLNMFDHGTEIDRILKAQVSTVSLSLFLSFSLALLLSCSLSINVFSHILFTHRIGVTRACCATERGFSSWCLQSAWWECSRQRSSMPSMSHR